MNNEEYEKIAPGLLKIQHVLGNTRFDKYLSQDNKQLLLDACQHIAELLDINLTIPSGHLDDNVDDLMESISMHSGIRIQKVSLEGKWWQQDLGLLLGFIKGKPCVLASKSNGGYQLSTSSENITLSTNKLSEVDQYAYFFTKPLPDKTHKLIDILKFSFSIVGKDIKSLLYVQFALSFLMMSIPLFMGYFFNNFSEFLESNQLIVLGIALVISTIIYFFFSFNQALMMLHLRFKVQRRLEPAIWDRLLKLKPDFFRQLNAGDIAYRAGVVSTIQEMLTQSTILSLFSVVIALVSFGLMCYFDLTLAIIALCGFFLFTIVFFILSKRFIIHQRKIYDYLAKQAGFVFQVINGIMKFKASASEFRAFNIWSDYFSHLLLAKYKAGRIQIYMQVCHGSILMLMTVLLFCVYFYQKNRLDIGTFIAFNAAFAQFFTAQVALTSFISSLVLIMPLFEKSLIIFESEIEPVKPTGSPINLGGKIQIKNLTFRYDENQPFLYKSINLTINPGEIIGITGSSGCGKSTLFRLLLGLEKPLDGQISYDDINLDMINLAILRQQIGVVTQKSVLTTGTILENIIGNDKHLTRTDAWDIIYQLGLEQMITALPMEMDTYINEGMQSLSGGEIQRIVLARALVKKPKILLLDEATSALDSQNQSRIQDYLRKLNVTQLVIAHRLSTLKNATRIIVVKDGQIIQNDNYEQLISQTGYFADLAKLQFAVVKNVKK